MTHPMKLTDKDASLLWRFVDDDFACKVEYLDHETIDLFKLGLLADAGPQHPRNEHGMLAVVLTPEGVEALRRHTLNVLSWAYDVVH